MLKQIINKIDKVYTITINEIYRGDRINKIDKSIVDKIDEEDLVSKIKIKIELEKGRGVNECRETRNYIDSHRYDDIFLCK